MFRAFTYTNLPRRFPRCGQKLRSFALLVAVLAAPLEGQSGPPGPIRFRGPYLQLVTPTSIVIRWRSTEPTDSEIRLGLAPGQLDRSFASLEVTTEHEVQAVGLTPNTRFFYSIGTTTAVVAGADADHFFFTPPPTGTDAPTRVWVIGDSGTNNGGTTGQLLGVHAVNVRDRYQEFTGGTYTNIWLMLGDNAYNFGRDDEYQFAVFETYSELLRQTVLWPSIGNHDGVSSEPLTQTGPYFDMFTLPANGEAGGVASMAEAFYSFDYANIHFVCLESDTLDPDFQTGMVTWLEKDLDANTQDWLIAYFHHPPYSKGAHDSDVERRMIDMRANVMPVLEAAGADVVFAGHSHDYERSFLINGHYGLSSTLTGNMVLDCGTGDPTRDGSYRKSTTGANAGDGTVYIVNGSSGGQSSLRLHEHPVMFVSTLAIGSVVLDVDGLRLDARFIDSAGAIIDRFVIEKTDVVNHVPCTTFLRGDANIDGRVNIADATWILFRLFVGLRPRSCDAAGDTDGDGFLRVADAIFLLRHLFQGGTPLPAPFPACGNPLGGGGLGCALYFACP